MPFTVCEKSVDLPAHFCHPSLAGVTAPVSKSHRLAINLTAATEEN